VPARKYGYESGDFPRGKKELAAVPKPVKKPQPLGSTSGDTPVPAGSSGTGASGNTPASSSQAPAANGWQEYRGTRGRHPLGLRERGQIDEPDAITKILDPLLGELHRQPRLAAASDARERQQSRLRQQPPEVGECGIATDKTRALLGQVVAPRPLCATCSSPGGVSGVATNR